MALSRRSGGRSRLTIALLVLTSLTLLTLDFRDAAVIQSARRTAANVFSPLRGAAETVSEPFTNAWHGVTSYGDVKAENERLRRRVEDLEGAPVLEEDAAQQLAELLAQQDLEWVGTIPTTAARVLSGSPSNFSHTVDISKGSNDGIKVGMPVVNGAGLVGKVVLVARDRSTVELITDPDFAVGIRLIGTQVTGTARGQGKGEDLRADTSLEPDAADLPKAGTSVTTSGIDIASFPASIPVGKVRSVKKSSDGLTVDLVIRPMADTERLAFLTVLLWEPPAVTPPSSLLVAVRTSLVLVVALTIQLGFAPGLQVFGVQADLLLLVAIAGGISAGPDRGAAIGFASGLAYDLFLQTPFGLSALTYAIVAYLVGGLQDSVVRAAWWIPVLTATAASVLGVILYGVFSSVLGGHLIGLELLRVACIVGLLNTVAAPFVLKAMGWATGSAKHARGPRHLPMITSETPRVRMSVLGIVVFALFSALFARLYYLQVMATDQYQVAAQANRIRVVPVEAPRGRILDRNGKVLVDNRISVRVTIDRTVVNELDDHERARVLNAVADALARTSNPKTVDQLEEDLANQRYSPYVPVPVADDVPEDLKIWIDEHGAELPGVAAERVAVRNYPYGQLAAHVLGYTGKIIPAEFEDKTGSAKPYTLNDEIGKYGVEKVYEDDLRGTPGSRSIEVDAENHPVRVVSETTPIPGDDVVLNLDIDVQAQAEQALQSGLAIAKTRVCTGCDAKPKAEVGSSVILDPNNGGVLAMASYPTFNPAEFVDGISDREWAQLTAKESNAPLNNWAIQGQYAPGSTFKPFSAVSALEAGLITPDTTVYDDGVYEVPDCSGDFCEFQNDKKKQYGVVDLRRSLTVSSDFFYYGVGARFWIEQDRLGGPERYADLLKQWGFDSDTGVDLSSEQSGRIPSPSWLKGFCEQITCEDGADSWRTGNNVNMAIGQGDVLLTPLQIASGYATIANGGTVWQPHVAKEVRDGVTHELKRTIEPKKNGTVELRPEWRQALYDGLTGVTTKAGGTAVGVFSGFPTDQFPVAAKTGTAQVKGKAPTAVFGAFGPANAPQYAISVLLEESGYGGSVAAPVARRLFDVLRDPAHIPAAPADGRFALLDSLSPAAGDVRD